MNQTKQIFLFVLLFLSGFGVQAGCLLPYDTIKLKSCAANNEICFMGLRQDLARTLEISINNVKFTGILGGCEIDTSIVYTYQNVFPIGPYLLDSWTVKDKVSGIVRTFTGDFPDFKSLTDSLNKWDPLGKWVYNASSKQIGGGFPGNSYGSIFVKEVATGNLSKTLNPNFGQDVKSTTISFGIGVHQVVFKSPACVDTVYVVINCTTPETVNRTIVIGQSDTICLNFSQLSGNAVSVKNICPNLSGTNITFSTIKGDSCVVANALKTSTDTACFVICDQYGFCDTTFFVIKGKSLVGTAFVYDTITREIADTLCINTKYLPGKPVSISNICSGAASQNVNFVIDSTTRCIYATASIAVGIDTICIVVCDDKGFCDTTIWIVNFIDKKDLAFYVDTVYVGQSIDTCLASKFVQPIVSAINLCAASSGLEALISAKPSAGVCQGIIGNSGIVLSYAGVKVGLDTACIEITDSDGRKDTLSVIITIEALTKRTIRDTIEIGSNKKLVLDKSRLSGGNVTVANVCTVSGKSVLFSTDPINQLCVFASGSGVGADTACWVICNSANVCDTLVWIVNVAALKIAKPIAVDDTDSVIVGSSKMIAVLFNDTVPGTRTRFSVLTAAQGGIGPLYGTVLIDSLNGSLLYDPNAGECNRIDFFQYLVCNAAGCDTALVTINIKCKTEVKPFRIYDAFSPNGDAMNEAFRIDGIELYPQHLVCVLNRWGQQVYRTKNYQNDWSGEWNGKQLPDGTYFYVFDTGEGNVFKGFVEIRR